MSGCFLVWLLPCEVEIIEDLLIDPRIVFAFNGVGEVAFEEFVACEHVADSRDFLLNNFVESFRAILEDLLSGVWCESQFNVDDVCPVVFSFLYCISPDPGHFNGLSEVF